MTRSALNAETGQRGYLLTLDRRYLEPFETGKAQYGPAMVRLKNLVGDDATPRQAELLDEIETLLEAKFAELDETVELTKQGQLLDAKTRVLSDEGQLLMNRLRRAAREMEQIENRILTTAANDTARAEAQVLPLLTGVMLLLIIALVIGYRLAVRAAQAEVKAQQAVELGEARDRADLLAKELNHRVKNLFAVILAIVRMSARDNPEAKPVVERIAERIHALLTAHEVTQGTLDKPVASLGKLIETTLAPYRSSKMRADLDGPDIMLPARQVTPLGLVLHELTTNAVKYGAWCSEGLLTVKWHHDGENIVIDWHEACLVEDQTPQRKGFGSMLMVSASRQLRGNIDRQFSADGVNVKIDFPLEQ